VSVYGISHNNYSMQFQQLQQDTDGTRSGSRAASSSSSASTGANAAASQAYGGASMIDHLSSAIQSAMDTLGLKPGDKVTFATIAQARKKMEDQFSEDVESGLQELGIDDADYTLVSDGKGGVTVASDHEDKAKIEQYFKDHPEMVDRFNEIQSMTNVDQARKVQGLGMDATNKREQIASLLNWFTGSGQAVNQLMRFDSGSTFFSAVGLSLRA